MKRVNVFLSISIDPTGSVCPPWRHQEGKEDVRRPCVCVSLHSLLFRFREEVVKENSVHFYLKSLFMVLSGFIFYRERGLENLTSED